MTKLSAAVLLSYLVSANSAFAIWGFSFKDYPSEVNLAYQFRQDVPRQEFGSCHVFAATSLIEAACYRNTGKTADISEAYFFNLHLLDQVNGWSDLKLDVDDLTSVFENREGGRSEWTLKRAFSGNMVPEIQYPWDSFGPLLEGDTRRAIFLLQTLEGSREKISLPAYSRAQWSTDKIMKQLEKYLQAREKRKQVLELSRENYRSTPPWFWDLDGSSKKTALQLRASAQKKFNTAATELSNQIGTFITQDKDKLVPDELRKYLKAQVGDSDLDWTNPAKPRVKQLDTSLNQCLTNNTWTWKIYTRARVVSLLNKGIPVICSGYFEFPGGEGGEHAWIISGYKYDPQDPKSFVYKIRESNRGWMETAQGCKLIIYIEPKN